MCDVLAKLEFEVRDQAHLMDAEGTKDTEIEPVEVYSALFVRGFVADNINISFDEVQKIWRFNCDIEPSVNICIGDYKIKRISIDDYEVTGPYTSKKKILCGGDFETLLSVLFI